MYVQTHICLSPLHWSEHFKKREEEAALCNIMRCQEKSVRNCVNHEENLLLRLSKIGARHLTHFLFPLTEEKERGTCLLDFFGHSLPGIRNHPDTAHNCCRGDRSRGRGVIETDVAADDRYRRSE